MNITQDEGIALADVDIMAFVDAGYNVILYGTIGPPEYRWVLSYVGPEKAIDYHQGRYVLEPFVSVKGFDWFP